MRWILIFSLLGSVGMAREKPPKQVAVDKRPEIPQPKGDDAARFAEAEAVLKRFEALTFNIDPKADMATWSKAYADFMQQQSKLMIELQRLYNGLASSAAPEYAVPALVRVGEVTERFAHSLTELQFPEGAMPPETLATLRKQLYQASESIRQTAKHHYQMAVQRADAHGVKGEWVDFARKQLGPAAKAP